MIGDAIASVLGKVIDRAWPDPAQRAAAAQALSELQQAGEFKRIDADLEQMRLQTAINQVEATSADAFSSRWRPFIGWICGMAFGWNFIGLPISRLICDVLGQPISIAPADMSEMMPILLGLLGLSGLRTYEKLKAP